MRNFLRNNILLLVLLNSGNIFNYLFQLVAGRGRSTIDDGSFNAVILTRTLASYFLSSRRPLSSL